MSDDYIEKQIAFVRQYPGDKDNPQNNFPLPGSGLERTVHAT